MEDRHRCLEELFAKSGRRIPIPRAVQLFGEPIQWVYDARYLGVTLDKRLNWSKHNDQVSKKAPQRLETLGSLLNRRSGLSIRNGVLLYKQLIRPVMDYACPVRRSAARSHIKKLQVLQSKCLRIANNAPWYIGNRQIHDDLGVPYFSDHIRSLNVRVDSKLAAVGNPLVEQLGRHMRWPSVDLCPIIKGNQDRQLVLVTGKVAAGTRPVPSGTFSATLTEVFPWIPWVISQMPGYNLWRWGTAFTPPKLGVNFYAVSLSLTLVWSLWVRIPGSLSTKVVPPKRTYCHVSNKP